MGSGKPFSAALLGAADRGNVPAKPEVLKVVARRKSPTEPTSQTGRRRRRRAFTGAAKLEACRTMRRMVNRAHAADGRMARPRRQPKPPDMPRKHAAVTHKVPPSDVKRLPFSGLTF